MQVNINSFIPLCKIFNVPVPQYNDEYCSYIITQDMYKDYIEKSNEIELKGCYSMRLSEHRFMVAVSIIESAHIESLMEQDAYAPVWKDLYFN